MAIKERDPLDPVRGRKLLVEGGPSFHDITEVVAKPIEEEAFLKEVHAALGVEPQS